MPHRDTIPPESLWWYYSLAMVRAYVPDRIPDASYIPLLYPQWGVELHKNELYLKEAFQLLTSPCVEIVTSPKEADIILVPHYYVVCMRKDPTYISRVVSLGIEAQKPVVLVAYGDSSEPISYTNTIVLRYSQYRSRLRPWEIIMPAVATDIGRDIGWKPREKLNGVPTLGFCGWADYKTRNDAFRAFIKNTLIDLRALLLCDPRIKAEKKGIYFRKKALTVFGASPAITPEFIVRETHSLNKKLISIDPKDARTAFIENIQHCDLSLTTRGDGNAATRFYEILSLGRLPVVVDTETILPFEDRIPYHEFCLIVPFTELSSAPEKTAQWYHAMSNEAYMRKQEMAREYFEKYLRIDSFYRYVFASPERLFSLAQPAPQK